MNYTTEKLKTLIEVRKTSRQKAVFLAGRIKKSNQSPGFDWKKAIEGFRLQFPGQVWQAKDHAREECPESARESIEWIDLIVYFSNQPYKLEEK